jgi:hypothetical protein
MKNFAHWPWHGKLACAVLILSILVFFSRSWLDRPAHHVADVEDGSVRMRPLRSTTSLLVALALILGVMTYGAFHVRYGFGYVLGVGLSWVFLAYCCYATYLRRYSFNANEFIVENRLLGRTQRFPWSSLSKLDGPGLFKFGRKRIDLRFGLSGRAQLFVAIQTQVLRLHDPLLPVRDERTLQALAGQPVLIGLLRADEKFQVSVLRQGTGTIKPAGENTLSIIFEDGETYSASINLRSLGRKKSGSPQWVATWYVNDPASPQTTPSPHSPAAAAI